MKKIVVIGCSNSTGEETRDYELVPDYYEKSDITHQDWYDAKKDTLLTDYFSKHPDKLLKKDPDGFYNDEQWKAHNELLFKMHGNNHYVEQLSWCKYSDQFSWPTLLNKNEEYEVYNFSTRGAGLSYFELAYNIPRMPKEYDAKGRHITSGLYKPKRKFIGENHVFRDFYNDKRNFKHLCDTADLLIWQFTNEPRYGLTFNIGADATWVDTDLTGFLVYGSSQESLQGWFPNYLKGDVLKNVSDYFKYYYDNAANFSRSLTWIEQLIELRENKGLKNMIFPIHRVFTSRLGFHAINNNMTKSYGFDEYDHPDSGSCPGILLSEDELNIRPSEIWFTSRPSPEQYCAKFTHPSEKGHRTIADWVHKKIQEDLL